MACDPSQGCSSGGSINLGFHVLLYMCMNVARDLPPHHESNCTDYTLQDERSISGNKAETISSKRVYNRSWFNRLF